MKKQNFANIHKHWICSSNVFLCIWSKGEELAVFDGRVLSIFVT